MSVKLVAPSCTGGDSKNASLFFFLRWKNEQGPLDGTSTLHVYSHTLVSTTLSCSQSSDKTSTASTSSSPPSLSPSLGSPSSPLSPLMSLSSFLGVFSFPALPLFLKSCCSSLCSNVWHSVSTHKQAQKHCLKCLSPSISSSPLLGQF